MNNATVILPANMTKEDMMIAMLTTQKEQNQRLDTMESKVDYLENEQPIHPGVANVLLKKRRARVVECLGGKASRAYQDRKFAQAVFKEAELDFKGYFNVPNYAMLPKKHELAAMTYWDNWQPSNNTKLGIEARNGQMVMDLIS